MTLPAAQRSILRWRRYVAWQRAANRIRRQEEMLHRRRVRHRLRSLGPKPRTP